MIFQIFSKIFRKFSIFSWFLWFSWFFHDFHDFFMKNQKFSKSPKFFAFYLESSKNVLPLINAGNDVCGQQTKNMANPPKRDHILKKCLFLRPQFGIPTHMYMWATFWRWDRFSSLSGKKHKQNVWPFFRTNSCRLSK